MSFHVVRQEHHAIFVVNRQTYETYRFTIGDDVGLAMPAHRPTWLKRAGRPLRS